MLINEAARDLYDATSARMSVLEAWYTDPAHKDKASHLHQLDSYFNRWHEIDKGRWLSDPDEIDGAYKDLEVAENNAAAYGFPLPAGHGKRTVTTTEVVNIGEGIQEATGLPTGHHAQEAVATVAASTPVLGTLTDPKNLAWCQRAGVSSNICGKDGLHMPDETPWWLYAVGAGGVLLVSAIGYAGYQGAKIAKPFVVPALLHRAGVGELVPHYDAFQKARQGGGTGEEQVRRMLKELVADSSVKKAKALDALGPEPPRPTKKASDGRLVNDYGAGTTQAWRTYNKWHDEWERIRGMG